MEGGGGRNLKEGRRGKGRPGIQGRREEGEMGVKGENRGDNDRGGKG